MKAQSKVAPPMELLARYLHAVNKCLPRGQQTDIVAELSDSIQSHMEQRVAELGRPLNVDDECAILTSYGHPLVAAGRYLPNQTLVGPKLLPFYWHTLTIVLWCAFAFDFVSIVITALSTGDLISALARGWALVWGTLFVMVGIVTTVFAVIERFQARQSWTHEWNPRSLPAVSERSPISRVSMGFELAFNAAFVLWLLDVPGVRHAIGYMMLGPGILYFVDFPFKLTAAIQPYAQALLAVSLVHVVLACVNLVRPELTRLRAATLVATNTLLAVVVTFTIRTPALVVLSESAKHVARYDSALPVLNWVAFGLLILIDLCCMLTVFLNLHVLFSPREHAQFNLSQQEEIR